MGETVDLPINVHNWSDVPQSGTVSLTLPANFTSAVTSKPYGPLAPGADATVTFSVTNTDTTIPSPQTANITVDDDQLDARAGHGDDRHVDPAQDDDRAGAGDPDPGRRRQPR